MLCVTQGCDASVLISSPNNKAEKDHPDDISLAGDGFDTVIKAKAAVDSDPRCKNKVSCADILALATRDVVALVCNCGLLSIIKICRVHVKFGWKRDIVVKVFNFQQLSTNLFIVFLTSSHYHILSKVSLQ